MVLTHASTILFVLHFEALVARLMSQQTVMVIPLKDLLLPSGEMRGLTSHSTFVRYVVGQVLFQRLLQSLV